MVVDVDGVETVVLLVVVDGVLTDFCAGCAGLGVDTTVLLLLTGVEDLVTLVLFDGVADLVTLVLFDGVTDLVTLVLFTGVEGLATLVLFAGVEGLATLVLLFVFVLELTTALLVVVELPWVGADTPCPVLVPFPVLILSELTALRVVACCVPVFTGCVLPDETVELVLLDTSVLEGVTAPADVDVGAVVLLFVTVEELFEELDDELYEEFDGYFEDG